MAEEISDIGKRKRRAIDMVSLNRVLLIGNLTKDPELRYIPSGTPVANLRLAVNSSFKDQAGQRK